MMESPEFYQNEQVATVQGEFIRRVYNWMGLGLAVTALVALYTASNPALSGLIFGNSVLFFGLIIAQFGLVIALSAAINRLQAFTATLLFFLYAALTGLTLR